MKKLFSLLLVNFVLTCNAQTKSSNGFTTAYISSELVMVLDTLNIDSSYIASGYLIGFTHANGRELELFVPCRKKGLKLNKIINILEDNNSPNSWPFFYVPFGITDVNVVSFSGKLSKYTYVETVVSQNEAYDFVHLRRRRYDIRYAYLDSAYFCVGQGVVGKINSYNDHPHLQDGPKVRTSKHPYYVFKEEDVAMRMLLPQSRFCR